MYKVFIADDEVWVTIGLKKMIEKSRMPFQVIGEAANGLVALEEIKERHPDVLITDIRMPGMDGLELVEQIRAINKEIKIVLISGYAEFKYAQKAIRMDVSDYLIKPIGYEQLEKVLRSLFKMLNPTGVLMEEELKEEVNPTIIMKIVCEIQKDYTKNINLAALSEKYNISVGRLSTLLKEELGMPYSEYVALKRVQKAKELLKDEKMSIAEVGTEVGYSDYCYFTKVFKKIAGITPSKYRKNL